MDQQSRVPYLKESLKELPQINQRIFSLIIGFLMFVSTFKEQNKMTTYNLSVVFAPCFLRPEVYTIEALHEYPIHYS